ncbi:MAG: 30S ribosomal protein S12 methylthiotransferase RimO [Anaerolineae bacterium]|nr:30S ribosomal protein S12 methylthiotransferase RimO [Anaerolineae bacterium]
MRYYLISLGCPKNTVDAQDMALLLQEAGYIPVDDPDDADLLLVNTCGFIEAARDESRQVLEDLARRKHPGQRLIAAGCWAQREGDELAGQISGLDGILGTRRWAEIVPFVRQLGQSQRVTLVGSPDLGVRARLPRIARHGNSAYLKIADGCSAECAFCAIPLIKGPLHSRPASEIVEDARQLADQGVLEIILIAQDTTAYGQDRGEKDALPDLLETLIETVPQVPWIRLMYAYPQHISARLIETMAEYPQICHYFDLPLQHAHPETLKRMRRPANIDRVRRLIDDLRDAMPDISLRTSFIVGYPGETEQEFRALEQFVREVRFDKMGVFTYSPEADTLAFDLPDRVPEAVMAERYDRLMHLQQTISLEQNQAQIGRVLDVLIEGVGEAETEDANEPPMPVSVGRTYRDAPEIDGLVLIEGEIEAGQMIEVEIVDAMEYDLIGAI